MVRRTFSWTIITLLLAVGAFLAPAQAGDNLILLDDTRDELVWVNRKTGQVAKTHALPNGGDGPFKSLDVDEAGNVFVLQEVTAHGMGRVVYYREATAASNALCEYTGYTENWLDIEWAGNGRVLLLNREKTGTDSHGDSNRLYCLEVTDYSASDNDVHEIGVLHEPSEGGGKSECRRIAFYDAGDYQGVWVTETDGDPPRDTYNPYTSGSGNDVFFFRITNYEGATGNDVLSGSNWTDAGNWGEYDSRTELRDVAVAADGTLILLELDNYYQEVEQGQNEADEVYRRPVTYNADSVSWGDQSLVAEWPHSYTHTEGSTEIGIFCLDGNTGRMYGVDHDDAGGPDRVYSLDGTFRADVTGYTDVVAIGVVADPLYDYTQTVNGGTLSASQTWSGNIRVTGDVTVPNGVTLTIDAGTRVSFTSSDDQSGGSYNTLPEIIVQDFGTLTVQGTIENPVVFTGEPIVTAKGDWGGIRSSFSSASQVMNMTNCMIMGARHGYYHNQNGGDGTLNLTNVRASRCQENGVYAHAVGQARLTVNASSTPGAEVGQKSYFASNEDYGFHCSANDDGTVLITNATDIIVENNYISGIYVHTNDHARTDTTYDGVMAVGHTRDDDWSYGDGLMTHCKHNSEPSLTIRNCSMYDNRMGSYHYAYYQYVTDNVSWLDNISANNNDYGMYCRNNRGDSSNIEARRNEVFGNGSYGMRIYREYWYHGSTLMDIVVDSNVAHDNGSHGIYLDRQDHATAYYTNATAYNNVAYGNAGDGINIDSHQSPHVYGNTCYQNTDNGIEVRAESRQYVYRNTVYENTSHGLHLRGGVNGGYPVTVYLNESHDNAGGDGLYLNAVGASDVIYNSFYNNAGDGVEVHATDRINLNYNNIYNNYLADTQYEIRNATGYYVDAKANYLGSSPDPAAYVYDRVDNTGVGLVEWSPYKAGLIANPTDPVAMFKRPQDGDRIGDGVVYSLEGVVLSESSPYTVQVSTDNGSTWTDIPGTIAADTWTLDWETPTGGNKALRARVQNSAAAADSVQVNIDPNEVVTSGTVTSDETWDGAAHGVINVTGDLRIASGATLNIRPGTTVSFALGDDTQSGYNASLPEIIVDDGGALVIGAANAETVTLTTAGDTPVPGLWGGITVVQSTAGTYTPVVVKNAVIEYATDGLRYVLSNASDPGRLTPVEFEDVVVRHCSSEGLRFELASADCGMFFTRVNVHDSGSHGIYFNYNASNVLLSMDTVTSDNNGGHGIYAYCQNNGYIDADLTDIRCSENGDFGVSGYDQYGMYWNNRTANEVVLDLASSPGADENTKTTFYHNNGYGFRFYQEDSNTTATINASAGVYSDNTISGILVQSQNHTIITATFENNEFAGHEMTNGWNYGAGLVMRTEWDCDMRSFIARGNHSHHNWRGIHNYNYYLGRYNDRGAPTFLYENNVCEYNTDRGIYHYENRTRSADIQVLDNHVHNNGNDGVEVYREYDYHDDWVTVLFEGNTVHENNGQGMIANRRTNTGSQYEYKIRATATDNVIWGNSQQGLYLRANGESYVYSNTLYNNGSHGLYSMNPSHVWVWDNEVYGNAGSGLYLDAGEGGGGTAHCDFNTITGNTSFGLALRGLYASDVAYNTIQGNTGHGVYLECIAKQHVNFNNIYGNFTPDTSYELYLATNHPVDARYNHFGAVGVDPSMIWDRADNPSVGIVDTDRSMTTLMPIPDAPAAGIKSPYDGASINGADRLIRGIAAADGPGFTVVVSTDGGATWNEATGTTRWSYTWVDPPEGPATIMAKVFGSAYTPAQITVDVDHGLPTLTGELRDDEVWDSSVYGDYVLEGDVTVPAGKALTITAGTNVRFAPGDDQASGNYADRGEIIVDGGSLFILGAEADPVVFTTNNANPKRGDWGGIWLTHSGAPGTYSPLVMEHVELYWGQAGLNYDLNNLGDAAHQYPIVINDVLVRECASTGMRFNLTSCSGAMRLTDVVVDDPGGHGLHWEINGGTGEITTWGLVLNQAYASGAYIHTYNSATWTGEFAGIRATSNGDFADGSYEDHGLYWYNEQGSDSTIDIHAKPEGQPNTLCLFEGNDGFGVYLFNEDSNTRATFRAQGGTYSANTRSGMYLRNENPTKLDYLVEENEFAGHTIRTSSREEGSGIHIYNYYDADISGAIRDNDFHHNEQGVYLYPHYSRDNQPVYVITGNTFRYNTGDGLHGWINRCRGLDFTISDNVSHHNGGNGMRIEREYSYRNNASDIMELEVFNNEIYSNSGRGIFINRDTHSDPYIYRVRANVHDNLIHDNGDDGLFVRATDGVLIWSNTVFANTNEGIEVYDDNIADILFNESYENTRDGVYVNTRGISNVNYNTIMSNPGNELQNGSGTTVDGRYNHFGGRDPADAIHDKNDDAGRGFVDYEPVQDAMVDIDIVNERIRVKDPVEGANEVVPISSYTLRGVALCRSGIKRVEVQTEAGGEWYPAVGTSHWSYDWDANRPGTFTVQARIIDDSDTIIATGNQVTLTVSDTIPTTTGELANDELWVPDNGDILVTGDVTVPLGTTLTIQEGTTIRLAGTDDRQTNDTNRVEFIINGTLRIQGTEAAPVLFRPDGDLTNTAQWGGLKIYGSGDSTLEVSHTTLMYAVHGIYFDQSGGTADVLLDHVTANDTTGYGVYVRYDGTSGTIHGSDIDVDGGSNTGVYLYMTGGSGSVGLTNVVASNRPHNGVYCRSDSSGVWDVNMANIVAEHCSGGDKNGIVIRAHSGGRMNYTLTTVSDPEFLSPTTANYNGRHGLDMYLSDSNSRLDVFLDGVDAHNNGGSGVVLNSNSSTDTNYNITNVHASGHTGTSGWDNGNGVAVNSYYWARSQGRIADCYLEGNYRNLYRRNDDGNWNDLLTIAEANTITAGTGQGMVFENDRSESHRIVIKDNLIENNNDDGIMVYKTYTGNASTRVVAEIVGNIIRNNGNDGVQIYRWYNRDDERMRLYAFLNIVTGNGQYAFNLDHYDYSYLYYNHMEGNGGAHDVHMDTATGLDARWNYWGATTTAEFLAGDNPRNISRIYDVNDNASYGSVQYVPWLDNPDPVANNVPPMARILSPEAGDAIHGGDVPVTGFATCSYYLDRVEVSVDGGATWTSATWDDPSQRTFWTHTWEEPAEGAYTLLSRAVNADGTVESQPHEITVTVDYDAATNAGVLPADEIWSGVVELDGDVTVPAGVTLTIQPGTIVKAPPFADATGSNDVSVTELRIEGSFICVGDAANRITMQPATGTSAGSWGGVIVTGGTVEMQHTDLLYPKHGLYYDASGQFVNLDFLDNTVVDYTGYGLYCGNAGGNLFVTDSVFTGAGSTGIHFAQTMGAGTSADIRITGCDISMNSTRGIHIWTDGGNNNTSPNVVDCLIRNNVLFRNDVNGIYVYGKEYTKYNLTIDNNHVEQTYGSGAYGIRVYSDHGPTNPPMTLVLDSNTVDKTQNGVEAYSNHNGYSATVSNNTVTSATGTGMILHHDNGGAFVPVVTGNVIRDNSVYNLWVEPTAPMQVNGNELSGSAAGLIALYNNSGHAIDATNNWWGVQLAADIDALVYDYNDDANKGLVSYDPWWDKYEPPAAPTIDQGDMTIGVTTVNLTGTKPADTGIRINNTQKVAPDASTTWAATWDSLQPGRNVLNVQSVDAFGLVSDPAVIEVTVDVNPPEFVHSDPTNQAERKLVERIVFTLIDREGTVNDSAVSTSVQVTDTVGATVAGSVSEANDQFTFTPSGGPLADGAYTVSFTAADTAGNSAGHVFTFIVDSQAPAKPSITGGAITSGVIQVRPYDGNYSNSTSVTLTGTRDADTEVFINGVSRVAPGTGDWSVNLTLSEGPNALQVWVEDGAGNKSASEYVDIYVDTNAPAFVSITPQNGSYNNFVPQNVTIAFTEATSGLSLTATTKSVTDGDTNPVPGDWAVVTGNKLVFTPTAPFAESYYTVQFRLTDNVGLQDSQRTYAFTVDTTPPAAPQLNPVVSPTSSPSQEISGTKEANTAIYLNGARIISNNADTTWQYTVSLVNGVNHLVFKARDLSGNDSGETAVDIIYDDVAPPAVTTLSVSGQGDGTTATLDWTGYDEAAHGDIGYYRIYAEQGHFTQVSGLTVRATVNAGVFTHVLGGLVEGRTYWFAVVAVDKRGNGQNSVTPVSAVPVDTTAPEEVTGIGADCVPGGLHLSWQGSANSRGDLDHQLVYVDGSTTGIVVPAGTNEYTATGLGMDESHSFRISVVDSDGNESSGVNYNARTWLTNPTGLSASGDDQAVDLWWQPVTGAHHYNVYMEATDYTDVDGLTPNKSAGASTSTRVSGLVNGERYYFAVTAVNANGCEYSPVTTVEAGPHQDNVGPVVGNGKANGAYMTDGMLIDRPTTFTIEAADTESGMDRVEFWADGAMVASSTSGPQYSFDWNVVPLADGMHTVTFKAYDGLGNLTQKAFGVNLLLGPPEAPVLASTSPAIPQGGVVGDPAMSVTGAAQKDTQVTILINDAAAAGPTAVDANGDFTMPLTLLEGENRIRATARHRGGISPKSNTFTVTLDTGAPDPPQNLATRSEAGGEVVFTWMGPATGEVPAGYNLYKSNTAFTDPSQAVRVNTSPLTGLTTSHMFVPDGTYHFGLTSVDAAGNESVLSNPATADVDASPPAVTDVTFTPRGIYVNGVYGVGVVDVDLTVSEQLLADPFVSISIPGATPIPVNLIRTSPTTYVGDFSIAAATPSGTGTLIFSGRDMVGNRGTAVSAPDRTVEVDTAGPRVVGFFTDPPEPVQNDPGNPTTVDVTMSLDQVLAAGTEPYLAYTTRDNPVETPVTGMVMDSGNNRVWTGQFTMDPADGSAASDYMNFVFEGTDPLDNVGQVFEVQNRFEIYQGDLPPFSPPSGLAVDSLPGGWVELNWNAVEGAAGYIVYRRAPGQTSLTVWGDGNPVTETYFTGQPGPDGSYGFAVSSIRVVGGQTSESNPCAEVEGNVDSVPPPHPESLSLMIYGGGVRASWAPPAGIAPDTYRMYRAAAPTQDVLQATLIQHDIGSYSWLDPAPNSTERYYSVTSVDRIGNESAPAPWIYQNVDLLPPGSLTVSQVAAGAPVLTWNHQGGGTITGYDLLVKSGTATYTILANDPRTSYTDTAWGGVERNYCVQAVDNLGNRSGQRCAVLPALGMTLPENAVLNRGLPNSLTVQVANSGPSVAVVNRLDIGVGGTVYSSGNFSVDPATTSDVSVVVGGDSDLADLETVDFTLVRVPESGTRVEITDSTDLPTQGFALPLEIFNETLVRGSTAAITFALNNGGDQPVEILTSSAGGRASAEIRVKVLDTDDNVIAQAPLRQTSGEHVSILGDGTAVASIPPGGTFTSAEVLVDIPLTAPDDVVIQVEIDRAHYHYGWPDRIDFTGESGGKWLWARSPVTLIDTVYFGELTAVNPQNAVVGQTINITGKARDRDTGSPVANVPVRIGVSINKFVRFFEAFTDDNGLFTYQFRPLSNEAGTYRTWAVHPDITDRPAATTFTISALYFGPQLFDLRLIRDNDDVFGINVQNSGGSNLTNVGLVYRAADQPGGVANPELSVTLDPARDFAGGETGTLHFKLTGTEFAPESGEIVLALVSDQTPSGEWGKTTVRYEFFDAQPALRINPGWLSAALEGGESRIDSVRIENNGLAAAGNMNLSLSDTSGGPAPSWIVMSADRDQGDLAPGDYIEVPVGFSPPLDATPGEYEYHLHVTGDNFADRLVRLYVKVVAPPQPGEVAPGGDALFHVVDLYYDGQTNLGLSGAKITLQNAEDTALTFNATSAAEGHATLGPGEALFEDLPEGRYNYRITKDGYSDYSGSIRVLALSTASEQVYLNKQLVQVEWEVVPVIIEDRYEIKLTATFETNVPAPVVTMEPLSVNLPLMEEGEVYTGEFKVTNHGLIRAENFDMRMPENNQFLSYELLGAVPDYLDAKQQIVVPFRITALNDLAASGEEGGGTGGGGCGWQLPRSMCASFTYNPCPGIPALEVQGELCGWIDFYKPCPPGPRPKPTPPDRTPPPPLKRKVYHTGWGTGGGTGGGTSGWGFGGWGIGGWGGTAEPVKGFRCPPPCKPGEPCNFCCQLIHGPGMGDGCGGGGDDGGSPVDSFAGNCGGNGPLGRASDAYNQANDMKGSIENALGMPGMLDSPCGSGGGGSGGGGGGAAGGDGPVGITSGGVSTASVINPVSGHYQDYVQDLLVSFGGVSARVARSFDRAAPWVFDGADDNIVGGRREIAYVGGLSAISGDVPVWYADTQLVVDSSWTIDKNDVEYACGGELPADGTEPQGTEGRNFVFKSGDYTIRTLGGYYDENEEQSDPYHFGTHFHFSGFLWKDPHGLWKRYDNTGRLLAYGSGDPATGNGIQMVWADGRVAEVLGPDGTKVFGYEYTGQSALPDAAVQFDPAGQEVARVEYRWTDQKLTGVTDAVGGDWTYAYDDKGRMTSKTEPGGRKYTMQYDIYDSVLRQKYYAVTEAPHTETLVHEIAMSYEYDQVLQEYRVTVRRTGAAEVELVHDRNGHLKERYVDGVLTKRVTTDTGKRERITRDGAGNATVEKFASFGAPTSVEFPDGTTTRMRYSSRYLRPVEIINRAGHATRYEYDTDGNLTATVQAANTALARRYENEYDADGNRTTIHNPDGATITKVYDDLGRVVSITEPENRTRTFTYNGLGKVETATDARGNTTTYGYDAAGRQVRVEKPASDGVDLVTEVSYDSFGNRVRLAHPDGTGYTLVYDMRDRLLAMLRLDTGDAVQSYEYDDENMAVTRVDANGKTRTETFDGFARLTGVTDGAGYLTEYVYGTSSGDCRDCDGAFGGRPERVIQPGGMETSMQWDWEGNLIAQHRTNAGIAASRSWIYDGMGRLVSGTDADGRTTSYLWDALGRKTTRINAEGEYEEVAYDGRDNVVSYTDGENRTTTFTHDLADRLTSWENPLGLGLSYTWDGNDNLVTETNARGGTTTYTHDKADRLVGYTTPEESVVLAWTDFDQLAAWQDGATAGNRTYDYLHRMTGENAVVDLPAGGAVAYTSTLALFANGTPAAITGVDGIADAYAYDGANKVASITLGGGAGSIGYTHDWKYPTRITYPNGVVTNLSYDGLWRLASTSATNGGTSVLDLGYGYDGEGNLTSLDVSGEAQPRGYTYDGARRLVSASSEAGAVTWTYDNAGNIVEKTGVAGAWTYNAAHQLTAIGQDGYTWDDDGNLATMARNAGTYEFTWDSRNRLTMVTDGAATIAEYAYDAFNRRVLKQADGATTVYGWRGDLLVGEWEDGALARTYVYMPGADPGATPVAMRTWPAGDVYFVHADHLGRPWALTDESGDVAWAASYDAHGKATVSVETVEFNFRLPGQYYDAETGLHYNRHRYYDPELGRYVSCEPLGVGLGSPNPYLYAEGNPLTFADPTGLFGTVSNVQVEDASPLDDLVPDSGEIGELLADLLCNRKGLKGGLKNLLKKKLKKFKWGISGDINWDNPLNPCVEAGINGWPIASANVSFSARAYGALALCNATDGW